MIIRGNLIKGPGHFLGNLILVLILIFKAGNNECVVFLSIPKNKKTKKLTHLEVTSTKQGMSTKTTEQVWTCHQFQAKKEPSQNLILHL